MKIVLFAAAMTLALATSASAQTAAPSPRATALARQIFEAQGGAKTVQSAVDSVQNSVMAQQLKTLPPERQARALELQKAAREAMADFVPKLVEFEVGFFAANYSEAQLADILAFYQTPTGRDLIAKAPLLTQQLGPFMAAQMPLIRTNVVDRYCAETACTADLKTAMLSNPNAATR